MTDDTWTTDSGLTSDYEGTVVDAWFAIDANYNKDAVLLFLQFETDIEATPVVTERYNCGPDWQSFDGGKSVQHPTKHKFNKNSQVGILVDKVAGLAGDVMRERGPATNAGTWIGTKWFMEAVTRKGTRRDTGEEWESTKNYPSKFLGVAEAGEAGATVGNGTSGPSGDLLSTLDPHLVAQMEVLANTLTHAEWVDKMMEVDGVLANDKLVAALVDESGLYASLKEEII